MMRAMIRTLPGGGWRRAATVACALLVIATAGPAWTADAPSAGLKEMFGAGASGEPKFLKPDEAFVLSTRASGPDRIEVRFDIADDYYLYRDKFKVRATAPGVEFGAPVMPPGETKHDEYFGEQVVYHNELIAELPVLSRASLTEIPFELTYQGCADAGLCYPPIRKQVTVTLAAASAAGGGGPTDEPTGDRSSGSKGLAGPTSGGASEQDTLAAKIRNGNLLAVIATFFGAGLLLAFTPCVLPMVPILSGIIVGAGRERPVSRGRAFSLSLAYVLGMASTYTIAGAAFAAAGQQAQAVFQKPWIIVAFAALFVWLALGMFGVFNLQVPAALQTRLSGISDRQKQGTLVGSAIMGALSSLIVTACVAPPLIATLTVIGQSGDIARGAMALFAMSIGMGAPLLVVGASAGALLPKAGAWMDVVKAVFGVLLLGVAIWMLSRILPGPLTLALWSLLAFVSGWYLMSLGLAHRRSGDASAPVSGMLSYGMPGTGAFLMAYGVLLLIGALAGRSDPLQTFAGLGGAADHVAGVPTALPFKRIKTVADLDREIGVARTAGRPVMLDFYADWCVSCKEMEKYTFPEPGVRRELERAVLLQADVTANDDEDRALMQRFGILGPPSILFFGDDGAERTNFRLVGFKPADEFEPHVRGAFAAATTRDNTTAARGSTLALSETEAP